jgi:hypothetical protein
MGCAGFAGFDRLPSRAVPLSRSPSLVCVVADRGMISTATIRALEERRLEPSIIALYDYVN